VKSSCQKYYLCTILFFSITCLTFAQSNNTVTIIGDPVSETSAGGNDSGGSNPYSQKAPPGKEQELASPRNIEPTFENGFHIRYEMTEPEKTIERPSTEYASIAPGSGGSGTRIKKKHVTTFTERTFYFKKKVKTWMPKRKKKYRPNVCGRF
jgi:hypothetical protein